MSDNRDNLRPYDEQLADIMSDKMAEAGIPQQFWPAQVVYVKPALPTSDSDSL